MYVRLGNIIIVRYINNQAARILIQSILSESYYSNGS
jgi:hypothetical protein